MSKKLITVIIGNYMSQIFAIYYTECHTSGLCVGLISLTPPVFVVRRIAGFFQEAIIFERCRRSSGHLSQTG